MTHAPTILLAEDESLIALDIQLSLEDEGLQVVGPYASVDECLEAAEKHEVDGAILDVDLRGKPVFPVAQILHKKGVPIVFHTGHADPRELTRMFPRARVCRKPTTVTNLIAHFRTAQSPKMPDAQ